MSAHSATPWKVSDAKLTGHLGFPVDDAAGHSIATVSSRAGVSSSEPASWTSEGQPEAWANAEFIVLACNAHDELVAALEMILDYDFKLPKYENFAAKHGHLYADDILNRIEASLAKARGES